MISLENEELTKDRQGGSGQAHTSLCIPGVVTKALREPAGAGGGQ